MKNLYIHVTPIPSQSLSYRQVVETRPAYQVDDAIGEIKPSRNLKDPTKIALDIETRTERAHADLAERKVKALAAIERDIMSSADDGWHGHAAVISWAVGNAPVRSVVGIEVEPEMISVMLNGKIHEVPANRNAAVYVQREPEALQEFFDDLAPLREQFVTVGHGVRRDLLFLWQRAIVHKARMPVIWSVARDAVRAAGDHSRLFIDTRELAGSTRDYVTHGSSKPGPDLDSVCAGLGQGTRAFMDNREVWEAIRGNQFARIIAESERYVRRTRWLYLRLTGLQELRVDSDDWVAPPEPAPAPPDTSALDDFLETAPQ